MTHPGVGLRHQHDGARHAGSHTVDLDGDPATGGIYDEAALSAMFVPYDGTGNPPTSFTSTAVSPTSKHTRGND